MKAKELNEKNAGELENLLKQEKARLVQLRFELASRQLKDHGQLKRTKKNIARINTRLKGISNKQ